MPLLGATHTTNHAGMGVTAPFVQYQIPRSDTKPMKKESFYFRNKALTRRHRWLGPLAQWVEQKGPDGFLVPGVTVAIFWIAMRLFVVHFWSIFVSLPWIVLTMAGVLATLSWALRKGKTNV